MEMSCAENILEATRMMYKTTRNIQARAYYEEQKTWDSKQNAGITLQRTRTEGI